MRHVLRGVLVLLPVLALTGCGAVGAADTSATPSASYGMSLAPTQAPTSADALIGWPGAAGEVVRCEGPTIGTTRGAPYDGEDVGASPEAALQAGRRWASWDGAQEGYALARVEASRRLYVFEVGGVAKQALILRHGPALKGDGTRNTVTRWWLESWARCDYSELPDAVAEERGLQIWSGVDGSRRPTSEVVSFEYSAGCYPGTTALDVGGPAEGGWNEKRRVAVEYIRNPPAELRDEWFQRDYAEHVAVPADAIDSGFERSGRHLWFSKDRGFAYIGARDDAEAWPRAVRPIRCA